MGSTLTFRAWLPELVIPEPPSLLPSFSFGHETKDSLGEWFGYRVSVSSFFMSGLYRCWPNAQLFSGRTELRFIRSDFGGCWGPSERWQGTDVPNPYPPPWSPPRVGAVQSLSSPCQAGERSGGGGGVPGVWRKKGGERCQGPCLVSPRQLGFLFLVMQVPDLGFEY